MWDFTFENWSITWLNLIVFKISFSTRKKASEAFSELEYQDILGTPKTRLPGISVPPSPHFMMFL